jgi:hypothetical protein
MDDKDLDLDAFINMFDAAMTSDNPAVKKALKNLLLITTVVGTDTPEVKVGPLRKLMDDMNSLSNRMTVVESQQYFNLNNNMYSTTASVNSNLSYSITTSDPITTWSIDDSMGTFTISAPTPDIDTTTMTK